MVADCLSSANPALATHKNANAATTKTPMPTPENSNAATTKTPMPTPKNPNAATTKTPMPVRETPIDCTPGMAAASAYTREFRGY